MAIKFAQHWTYEAVTGAASTKEELIEVVRQLPFSFVLGTCSVIGILLQLWARQHYPTPAYVAFINKLFESALAARILSSRNQLLFCRRQLLLLARLAIEYAQDDGPAIQEEKIEQYWHLLGRSMLMLNDRLHFGLAGTATENQQRAKNLFRRNDSSGRRHR